MQRNVHRRDDFTASSVLRSYHNFFAMRGTWQACFVWSYEDLQLRSATYDKEWWGRIVDRCTWNVRSRQALLLTSWMNWPIVVLRRIALPSHNAQHLWGSIVFDPHLVLHRRYYRTTLSHVTTPRAGITAAGSAAGWESPVGPEFVIEPRLFDNVLSCDVIHPLWHWLAQRCAHVSENKACIRMTGTIFCCCRMHVDVYCYY